MPAFISILAYPFPLLWLWGRAGYPESFGIRPGMGRGGVYVRWWDSYLLLERHHFWDVVAFAYMWPGIVGLIIWVMRATPKIKLVSPAEEGASLTYAKDDAR